VIAVSPLLPIDAADPARLTARRIEPGSVVVELKDVNGLPARGYVEIGSGGNDPFLMGSTDVAGVVRFNGVSTWKYTVRAYLDGRPMVDLGEHESPVPEERLLRGTTAVLDEPVTPEPNAEKRIVLRETAVGYVLAAVRPPAGRTTSDFSIYLSEAAARHGAKVHYRPSTGECVAGPFPRGEVRLHLLDCGVVSNHDVKVEAGNVTRIVLTPPTDGPRPLAGRGSMLIGVGGASYLGSGAEGLTGRVLLPDGKEPALAAVVLYFEPGRWEPVVGGLTDARGQIRGKGLWHTGNRQTSEPADDPPGPVIVAFLPGSHGAAVVPLPQKGKPLEVVLPPPAVVRGRVTVAGVAPSGKVGSIRILAAYEGKGRGRFGDMLSVRATAQEDGSFELAALTPGRYSVQAALDSIWLSPATIVDVTDRASAAMNLAIPAPGGSVVAKMVGPDDKPLAGRSVRIERPSGPLTNLLWPVEWKTDGAGVLHIPTLEAGRHTLSVTGTNVTTEVVVPPLPSSRVVEVMIRVGRDVGR
jgi:hypothetical protein